MKREQGVLGVFSFLEIMSVADFGSLPQSKLNYFFK